MIYSCGVPILTGAVYFVYFGGTRQIAVQNSHSTLLRRGSPAHRVRGRLTDWWSELSSVTRTTTHAPASSAHPHTFVARIYTYKGRECGLAPISRPAVVSGPPTEALVAAVGTANHVRNLCVCRQELRTRSGLMQGQWRWSGHRYQEPDRCRLNTRPSRLCRGPVRPGRRRETHRPGVPPIPGSYTVPRQQSITSHGTTAHRTVYQNGEQCCRQPKILSIPQAGPSMAR